ncbi:hypothetical protein ABNG02_14125 [Halorubrum ejinorense]|uniref:Glutamine amidotransferase domain-containing protein n=1 Tax=Halorubrum ejinorense TaxID=425309 RepID=A0ABV4IS58_9EURY
MCFGHQILNAALGGEVVDSVTSHIRLKDADLYTDVRQYNHGYQLSSGGSSCDTTRWVEFDLERI